MTLDEMYLRDADEAYRRKQERNANGSSGEQPESEGAAADDAEAKKKKAPSTQADRLIALAMDSVELFHYQDRAYADIRVDGHRETWPVKSKRFRQWLKRLYYAKHNKAPNAEAVWTTSRPSHCSAAMSARLSCASRAMTAGRT